MVDASGVVFIGVLAFCVQYQGWHTLSSLLHSFCPHHVDLPLSALQLWTLIAMQYCSLILQDGLIHEHRFLAVMSCRRLDRPHLMIMKPQGGNV